VTLKQFAAKQFIAVIQWSEPQDGILAYRYPMRDMEIQTGARLTVRESQMAAFVNEGKIADIFGPGLYTLNTHNLPLLTDLKNWDKGFESPFKSDVYFFSTRLQINQKWGTGTPITFRDKEFGAVSIRCYGIYSYHISDPRTFFTQVSGTLGTYPISELEGQLRAMIVGCITDVFAKSSIPFLDLTANKSDLADKFEQQIKPAFTALGLELTQFVLENISLPDDLQELLDQRIGMNIVGDLSQYTRFAAAESLPIAAANPGGAAGIGVGLGAGVAAGHTMLDSLRTATTDETPPKADETAATAVAARYCTQCGKSIPLDARFCPACGKQQ
jgi:membrane protease subunit (stomatin/prohibitin family)